MKHLQKHRGRLYYRRKVPADLLPAFNNKPHWRRALELSVDAPQAEITARWAELHQNFKDLIDLARRSNMDVLSEIELEKKARAYLRNERIEAGEDWWDTIQNTILFERLWAISEHTGCLVGLSAADTNNARVWDPEINKLLVDKCVMDAPDTVH